MTFDKYKNQSDFIFIDSDKKKPYNLKDKLSRF